MTTGPPMCQCEVRADKSRTNALHTAPLHTLDCALHGPDYNTQQKDYTSKSF